LTDFQSVNWVDVEVEVEVLVDISFLPCLEKIMHIQAYLLKALGTLAFLTNHTM
jgi:hypothetical protein